MKFFSICKPFVFLIFFLAYVQSIINPFYRYKCHTKNCRHRSLSLSQPILTSNSGTNFNSLGLNRKECQSGQTCKYYYNCNNRTSKPRFCSMTNGFTGVCCQEHTSIIHRTKIPNIGVEKNELNQIIKDLEELENEISRNDIHLEPNTKEFFHQNFFGTNQLALKEMQNALQALHIFISFSQREKLSNQDIANFKLDLRDTYLANLCKERPICLNVNYRTADGTCNNLIDTLQGKALSTFTRLLPPDYDDGINSPRRAKDGAELPNARQISISISPEATIENNLYSLMLMQFGQFIDHDLTRTSIIRTHDNKRINCCDEKVIKNPKLLHPACFAISVPTEDIFLRAQSQTCINFVRSTPSVNPKCQLGPREQLNQLSSYLDGNNIYGASVQEVNNLRLFRRGQLKFSLIHNKTYPPIREDSNDLNCNIPRSLPMKCFAGGDIRANEVVDLTVLHTVWLREHNRIASILEQLNPSWNDETLYQETKRIVVAELQHIIYNEFLPLIIGTRTMEYYGLNPSSGFIYSYNPAVDPTILNEFSTAAFRLHSLVQGTLNLNSPDNQVLGHILLREVFNNPVILYQKGGYEMRIAGLTGQPIQNFDNFFSEDMTNHLFQEPGKRFGLDIVALNIQRGRDHGIPGYVHYREICGLSKVKSFEDLKTIFSNPSVVDIMKHFYKRVEDIDLFIAGTSEKTLPNAIVGPTFACIIGEQFRRIKEGDRFWYENGNLNTSFKYSQLTEIKKVSLARVLCDNSDIGIMHPFAFLIPNQSNNPKVNCHQLPMVNLNEWKNSKI